MDRVYRPNPEALFGLTNVDFIAVIGATASGKSTLIDAAIATNSVAHLVLTTTSRQPRLGEHDDIDLHFRTRDEMEPRMARGEFVQVAPAVFGDLYATAPEDYGQSGVAVMPVIVEALPTFRELPFKWFREVYILPPSWEVWQERLRSRNFTAEQMARRKREAARSLEYAATANCIFIINDNLADATRAFGQIIAGEDYNEAPNQAACHQIAHDLIKKLHAEL